MGDVSYRQKLEILCGPLSLSNSITVPDFSRSNPPTTNVFNDLETNLSRRFKIAPGVVDEPLCLGATSVVKVLVLEPAGQTIPLKLVNGLGTSQTLTFAGDRTSILHLTDITDILISNPHPQVLEGVYLVAGD